MFTFIRLCFYQLGALFAAFYAVSTLRNTRDPIQYAKQELLFLVGACLPPVIFMSVFYAVPDVDLRNSIVRVSVSTLQSSSILIFMVMTRESLSSIS